MRQGLLAAALLSAMLAGVSACRSARHNSDAAPVSGSAPEATLIASNDRSVPLAELWRDRHVVLVFYRGHW